MGRFLSVLILLVLSVSAVSADDFSCPVGQVATSFEIASGQQCPGGPGPWASEADAVAACGNAAQPYKYNGNYTGNTTVQPVDSTHFKVCSEVQYQGSYGPSCNTTIQVDCAPPPPNPCSGQENDEYSVPDGTASAPDGTPYCNNGCEVLYRSNEGLTINASNPAMSGITGGEWFDGTGRACTGSESSTTAGPKLPNPQGDNQVCKQVPIYDLNGQIETTIPFCSSTSPSQDGHATVDGTPHDYTSAPPKVCAQLQDGSEVCDSYPAPAGQDQHQPTPPAPNKGPTGGTTGSDGSNQSADPDGCLQTSYVGAGSDPVNTQTCVYGASTVANSSTSAGGGGKTTGSSTGTTTAGSTGGSTGTTTGGTGGCTDLTSATCVGAFSGPTLDDVPTYGDKANSYRAGLAGTPAAQELAQIANSIPSGGTAPSANFEVFGRTFTLTPPQQVIDAIRPVLAIVMRLVWCITALLIFFRRW